MRSLSSVRVFWPNTSSVKTALEHLASLLIQREEVLGVYLCGSWARGSYTAASDVDVLVMIRDGSEQSLMMAHDRVPAYLPGRFPVSLDLFVFTPDEADQSPFARHLLEYAVPLARKDQSCSPV